MATLLLLARTVGKDRQAKWLRTSANAQLSTTVPLIVINTIIIVYELILG